jgi:hypothetical protein
MMLSAWVLISNYFHLLLINYVVAVSLAQWSNFLLQTPILWISLSSTKCICGQALLKICSFHLVLNLYFLRSWLDMTYELLKWECIVAPVAASSSLNILGTAIFNVVRWILCSCSLTLLRKLMTESVTLTTDCLYFLLQLL